MEVQHVQYTTLNISDTQAFISPQVSLTVLSVYTAMFIIDDGELATES